AIAADDEVETTVSIGAYPQRARLHAGRQVSQRDVFPACRAVAPQAEAAVPAGRAAPLGGDDEVVAQPVVELPRLQREHAPQRAVVPWRHAALPTVAVVAEQRDQVATAADHRQQRRAACGLRKTQLRAVDAGRQRFGLPATVAVTPFGETGFALESGAAD